MRYNASTCRSGNIFCSYTSRLCRYGLLAFVPITLKPGLLNAEDEKLMINFPPEKKYAKPKEHGLIGRTLIRIWDIFRCDCRIFILCIMYSPLVLLYPFACLSNYINDKWWSLFVFTVEHSGPTFIKLGQWASTRRDLFSSEFCDRFSKLHRKARVHSWYYTRKELQKAFGKKWRKVFLKFENNRQPIGSGCIAQVYKAWMNSNYIQDESILEEIRDEQDDEHDRKTPDIFEGLEILGFGRLWGSRDEELDRTEQQLSEKNDKIATPEQNVKPNSEQDNMSQSTVTISPVDEIDENCLVPVAIKVLHPGMYREFQRDLDILKWLAGAAEFIFPSLRWLSLKQCVEEFSGLMEDQLNLKTEAKNLEMFRSKFEDVSNVHFPCPIYPFVRRNVLVESFEEGEYIANFIDSDSSASDPDCGSGMSDDEKVQTALRERLANIGVDTLLKMVFVDNFVHGDLHPGNILVQNAAEFKPEEESRLEILNLADTILINVKPVESPLRIVLLDTGITVTLSDKDKENFRAVFTAVVKGEGEKVADLLLEHAPQQSCQDVDSYRSEVAELVHKARNDTICLSQIKVSELLTDLFKIVSSHKVKLDSNFATIVIAIMVLEGLGRSLDPHLDIMEKAKGILLKEALG